MRRFGDTSMSRASPKSRPKTSRHERKAAPSFSEGGVAQSDESVVPSPAGWFDRALVLEDNPLIRTLVAGALRRWGVRVIEAADVEGARAKLSTAPDVDLLLVDVRLPDGSGATIAREVALRVPRPVVVAMSAVATPREAFDLSQAGVRAFLPKPFSPEQLSATLRHALVEHELDELRAGRKHKLAPPTRTALADMIAVFARMHDLVRGQRSLTAALVRGTARAELAAEFCVSENTMKKRLRRLLSKCNVQHAPELVLRVWEHRIAWQAAAAGDPTLTPPGRPCAQDPTASSSRAAS